VNVSWVRPALAALLVALIGSVAWLNHLHSSDSSTDANPDSAYARYGFRLQEVSHQSGIDFVHQAPVLDGRLDPIMPEIASMGASVTICDYNKDGWPDIYVTNSHVGSQNHLYRNNHDGTFTDVAAQLGIADLNEPGTGVCMGALWGDFENTGYEDLLVYKWGHCRLFHNDQGKRFIDITQKSGLPAQWMNINSATAFDYDRDGRLDILLCGYYPDGVDLWHLKNTRMMPESFEYAQNGGRKWLLRNRGDGTFVDVTQQMGIDSHSWTLACAAADLRGTGYPDIFLANDYGVSQLYANEAGQGFKELGKQANIGYRPKSGMNISFGDITNSGQFALYVSNISSDDGSLVQGNNLWVPEPGTGGDSIKYDNLADDDGVSLGGWSFGAQFGDLNNAGYLDLVLTNGFVSASRDRSYWYDFGKVAGGNSAIISDASNWPPMGDMSLSGYEKKKLWLGNGDGQFTDVAQGVGFTDTHDGRAVALADLWNTGALDIVMATQRGPLLVYKNTVNPANKWVEFQLEGTRCNRGAIGAEVRLYWKNGRGQQMQQLQEVMTASGFCSENDRRLHYGLGPGAAIEKVTIRWPDAGPLETITSVAPDALHAIKEPS
jgi:enediyne biosynthesis protein E4